VRCAFSDRILHSKMPLDPTHVRLKLLHACDQWHSSREPTCSYRCDHKLCRNTEGHLEDPSRKQKSPYFKKKKLKAGHIGLCTEGTRYSVVHRIGAELGFEEVAVTDDWTL
jgi:hypothetical protein